MCREPRTFAGAVSSDGRRDGEANRQTAVLAVEAWVQRKGNGKGNEQQSLGARVLSTPWTPTSKGDSKCQGI